MENFIEQVDKINLTDLMDNLVISEKINSTIKTEKAKLPFHINVIKSAAKGRLKETAHSEILVDLLKDDKILDSFINFFFSEQGLNSKISKVRNPDKDRIDVSIIGEDYFIIIENKVNGADEQCGQIYNYYHKAKEIIKNEDKIYVLYLNPQNNDEPSSYSLNKDGKSSNESVKERLGNRLIVRNYKEDILEWIKSIKFEDKEYYLNSAITQYQDYLENKFQISKRYDSMNKIIADMLKEKLSLGTDLQENFKKIEDSLISVSELQNYMTELRNQTSEDIARKVFGECIQECKTEFSVDLKIEGNILSYPFKYNDEQLSIQLRVYDGKNMLWMIHHDSGNADDNTRKQFTEYLKSSELTTDNNDPHPEWHIIINKIATKNAKARFISLMRILIQNNLINVITE